MPKRMIPLALCPLMACAQVSSAPAPAPIAGSPPVAKTTTAPPPPAPAPEAKSGPWVDSLRSFGVAPLQQGAMSHGVVSGALVAALSYASEATPFEILTARKGEPAKRSAAPWQCSASPADLTVSGDDAWVHCIEPAPDKRPPRVHFWHSGDAGRSWSRAGALDGIIAMGQYAMSGSTLFVSGSFEGKGSRLIVITRGPGKPWTSAPAASPPENKAFRDVEARAVVASDDGRQIVVLGALHAPEGSWLLAWSSVDGGKTLSAAQKLSWPKNCEILSPSIVEGRLHFVVELDGAFIYAARAAITSAGVPHPDLTEAKIQKAEACGWGTNLAARAGEKWLMSRDGGASFTPIPAPPADPAAPALLECSRSGVQVGAHLHAWSSP
jgi:hypothetical protein